MKYMGKDIRILELVSCRGDIACEYIGSMQAGIYWVYACMISRLPKMPTSPVFSRVCGLLKKRQMYRNLSQIGVISHQNGVVNGVVECSWLGDGDVKYHIEMV